MRSVLCLIGMLTMAVWIPVAEADIYVWVDEGGLRHISNVNPPARAEVLLTTEEAPHNAAVGTISQERLRRKDIQKREADIGEREARLAQREAELERRIEAVEKKAQAALDQAAERLATTVARDDEWATDRRYVLPAITSIFGAAGYRPHHHKHRRDRASQHRSGLSFKRRSFPLGAIHLPLGPIGLAPRRHQPADGRRP
jgi:hypothetical protein